MKIAAGIIGILAGLFALSYVGLYGGLIGIAAGWIGSFGPTGNDLSAWGPIIKLLSWLAPLLVLLGGGLAFRYPGSGAAFMAVGAFALWYLLGFGVIGNIFILPAAAAAVFAMIAAVQDGEGGELQGAQPLRDMEIPKPRPEYPPAIAPVPVRSTNAESAIASVDSLPRSTQAIIAATLIAVLIGAFGWMYTRGSAVPAPATTPLLAVAPPSPGPSFDCTRAFTWSAREVCSHEALATQDRTMAELYRARMHELATVQMRTSLRTEQRAWLRMRDNCVLANNPLDCLTSQYSERITRLSSAEP